jgi:hypothetical protein
MKPIDRVLGQLDKVRKTGTGWTARCPAHDDKNPSLSVSEGHDGRVLLNCQAGCSFDNVCAALGVGPRDLFASDNNRKTKTSMNILDTYDYTDETGELLFQVCRLSPRSEGFRQRRPDGNGGWEWSTQGVRRVLYHLNEAVEGVKAGRWILVTEGEKDVDRLRALGFVATCNPGGAGKWRDEFAEALAGAKVAILPDHDETGYDHADALARSVYRHAEAVKYVVLGHELPDKGDVSDWLDAGHDAAELKQRIEESEALRPPARVIQRATVVLGADGVAVDVIDEGTEIHLFESPPSQGSSVPPPGERATVQPPPPLAWNPLILNAFRDAIRKRGVVGEETTACFLFLVVTSRLLDKQVSAAIKGHSSSGKSFTTERTIEFFPPEAVLEMTAMSEKALVYMEEEYAHRTLVLYEAVALREGIEDDMTAYFVRSLLSEGRIRYPVTEKDKDGKFVTRTIEKDGPTNLILTTTKTKVHAENETRLLSFQTDDSREQTKRILAELAAEDDEDVDLDEWVQLQRWLQGANHRVTIPYAARLAELVPPVAVRMRRDFGAVLALIRAHAVLHQLSRETDDKDRIVASVDDYREVRRLVHGAVSEGVGSSVPDTIRQTVQAVEKLAASHANGVPVVAIAGVLGLDKSAAWRRVKVAADKEYLRNEEDRRGQPGRWVVGEPLPESVVVLPSVDELTSVAEPSATPETVTSQGDSGTGCTVATASDGGCEQCSSTPATLTVHGALCDPCAQRVTHGSKGDR